MEIYKSPLSPSSNESLRNIIQNNDSDENYAERISQILTSIDFDLLTKSNEEIDLLSSKKMFSNLLTLLNSGMVLTDFPDILIPRILDLSSFYSDDHELTSFSINFIFYLSQIDDEITCTYVNEIIIDFLLSAIDPLLNIDNVYIAILCLTNFTSIEKPNTSIKLSGLVIFQKVMEFLTLFNNNFDFNDKYEYRNLILSALDLVSNVIISYILPEVEIENVVIFLIQLLNPIKQSGNEIEDKVNRIWQISAAKAISKTIYRKLQSNFYTEEEDLPEKYKEDEQFDDEKEDDPQSLSKMNKSNRNLLLSKQANFYLSHFIKPEVLDLLINLVKSDFEFELETLSIYIFSILENLSFADSEFSFQFLAHFSSLLFFKPPEEWGLKAKKNFCRTIITSIESMRKYRELNKGGELLVQSMDNLRNSVQDIVVLMMNYIDKEGYKLRKVATMVLCQFISLNDSVILNTIMQGYDNIVEDFVFFLDDDAKPNYAYPLIKSLKILCLFGDNNSEYSSSPNLFLGLIMNLDIEEVLDRCETKYAESRKLIMLINNFKILLEKLKECQDIDKFHQEDETIELFI